MLIAILLTVAFQPRTLGAVLWMIYRTDGEKLTAEQRRRIEKVRHEMRESLTKP